MFPSPKIADLSSNKQHLRADFGQTEQFGDMFVVEANATVRTAPPDLARVPLNRLVDLRCARGLSVFCQALAL